MSNLATSFGWSDIVAQSTAEYLDSQGISPKFTREMVDHELSRFYYDTAQVANEVTIQALAKLVGLSQIVFGTDYPYRTSAEHVAGLAKRFSADDLVAIDSGNVSRILPKWG